ncbi:unnamed protein product, partial [Ectocarpus sp. 12 AP-2014]
RGLSVEPIDNARPDDADASLDDSEVAYIARSKRDVAEHFGVAWSTMQPRLVGKVGGKPASSARAANLPDEVETELFQHVLWLCENGHPTNWDNIKAIAWKLGKMAGIEDFAASNHWLKRFKTRFPTLEARYSHHLRTTQLRKADMASAERWRDERDHSDATSLGDGGSSGGEGGGGGGRYVVPTDLKATTSAGEHLALERAKVEAEAGTARRHQQQQAAGIALNTAGAVTPTATASGAAAGVATSTSAAHQEAQLRLAHASMVGGLPGHLLSAHPYNGSQLQIASSPHGRHRLLDSTVRGGVWGQAGTGVLVGSPSTLGEIPPTTTPPPNFQLQQQYQHLGLGLHQAGQMGIGGQRMVPIPGQLKQEPQQEQQQQQQQQQQHLVSGGGVPGVPSGQMDASRMQAVRSQGPTPMQFAGMAGQNMNMGLGGGAHPQQVGMAMDARGGAMTTIYPPAGVGGAGTQAMGMVGPWQAAVGWAEQLMGPWQHVAISQVQGTQQQQLLHPAATPPSSYESQGMLNPSGTGLALLQQQQQHQLQQQLLQQQHQQRRQQQQQQQHHHHQGPDSSAWLNSPAGLGLGQHPQPAMLASVALGHAVGNGGGGGGGADSLLDMQHYTVGATAGAGSAEQESAQHQEQPPK